MVVSNVWQCAIDQLEQSGVYIDAREQDLVDSVRQDFEKLSASIQNQPGFVEEAPKLAAMMVSYAIERDRLGLTDYETF